MPPVQRPEDEDVGRAFRRLIVRVLHDPTIEMAITIGVFSLIGWVVDLVTGHEFTLAVWIIVGLYDVVVGSTAVIRALRVAWFAVLVLFGRY
jgi:hypothetical protein